MIWSSSSVTFRGRCAIWWCSSVTFCARRNIWWNSSVAVCGRCNIWWCPLAEHTWGCQRVSLRIDRVDLHSLWCCYWVNGSNYATCLNLYPITRLKTNVSPQGGWGRMSFQTSHFVHTIHHLESTLLMEDMGCTKLCRLWNSLKVKMSLKLYVEHNLWPKSCIASAPSQFHLEYNERRKFLLETHHFWGPNLRLQGG